MLKAPGHLKLANAHYPGVAHLMGRAITLKAANHSQHSINTGGFTCIISYPAANRSVLVEPTESGVTPEHRQEWSPKLAMVLEGTGLPCLA